MPKSRTPRLNLDAHPAPVSQIRSGLIPRVIYFPEGWLERIESRGPGSLVDLLTIALSEHQAKGGA